MKPLLLKISAFGPYAEEVTLDFRALAGRTFFLIHGPTGAGKTTILDAMCFALYGDTSGHVRDSKSVRSDHAKASVATEVEFTFAIGELQYKVKRSPEQLRPKKRGEGTTLQTAQAELFKIKDQEVTLLTTGYSDVIKEIECLLGFKSSQFRQVVLLPQGDFRKLLTANSTERQEIMQTLFKTELYRKIEEHLNEKYKQTRQVGEELTRQRNWVLNEAQTETLEELTEKIAENQRGLSAKDAELHKVQAEMENAQQQVNDGKIIVRQFQELAAADAERKELEGKIETVNVGRTTLLQAQNAAVFLDAERQLQQLEKDQQQYQTGRQQQLQQVAGLEKECKIAADQLKAELAKEPERQKIAETLVELNALADKVTALQEAEIKKNQCKQVLVQSAAAKTAGQEQLTRVKMTLQEQLKQQEKMQLQASQLTGSKIEVENAKRIVQKRKALEITMKELADAKKILSNEESKLGALQQEYDVVQNLLQKLQHLFMEGQAAILAATLGKDTPCPVCGSTTHPSPAVAQDRLPSEAEIQKVQDQLNKLEKSREDVQQFVNGARSKVQTLINRREDIEKELGEDRLLTVDALTAAVDAQTKRLQQAQIASEQLEGLEKEITRLKEEELKQTTAQETLEEKWRIADRSVKELEAIVLERQAVVPEMYRDHRALAEAEAQILKNQQSLKAAFEKAQLAVKESEQQLAVTKTNLASLEQQLTITTQRYKKEQDDFSLRLEKAGFFAMEDYQKAKKSSEYIEKLAERIQLFDTSLNNAKARYERALATTAKLKLPDMAKLEQMLETVTATHRQVLTQQVNLKSQIAKQSAQQEKIRQMNQQLEKLGEVYGIIGKLAEVANGKNEYGLTFQRFVLGALLEDVADAANMRLKMMSRGRYLLQRTMDRARKNAAGGLELEVLDNYTGIARSVGTLSGGETFLASLSLALGLADVVQSYAGGMHLDTILVDEGFGTLDPEALDMAMKALVDLQKGGRLVGIISHVPELKERIDARLEVSTTKYGSTARFKIG
ncbi:AAA family ATPase [Anaerosinus massiliensis]|uniref:AAA family ATPase n=1 Tax=Massilibacillus massiliensis TaxID=1806837 RepID=UPI000A71B9C5|nr:SMC family ATPase [Massilibacillus massiliensis]